MYKIFLVEDEFVVREGIKKNIDWAAHGYEFCGDAGDGELALPLIQKYKPDIVITDIKMPFMDGLALSKLIKKELPATEIILLSGYEEFEYAKEGIKIGIAQYLTKPISGEELIREVDAVASKMEEKKRELENARKYKEEMEENILQEKKNFFQYLVTGTKTVPQLLEISDELGIDISAVWYNVVLFISTSANHTQEEYSNSLVEIEEQMKKLSQDYPIIMFDRNLEGKALIFKADSENDLTQMIEDYFDKTKKIMEGYKQVRYFGGIGKPVNRLTSLPESFEMANHAFAHRFLIGESSILNGTQIEENDNSVEQEFNIGSVEPKQLGRNKIEEFLKLGNQEETIYFVEEFFKGFDASAMKSTLFRQYIAMDVYFTIAQFVENLSYSKDEIETFDVASVSSQNMEETMKYIVRIMDQAISLRERSACNHYGDIVDEMIHYIEENYGQEELSLNLLASHVNFSPNHLSMIFSQQTGQTFIKYLTDYRMNKAKELLKCTGKKSSAIAAEVGYKDPHYFSYLFKKTQKMTPTQYREQG